MTKSGLNLGRVLLFLFLFALPAIAGVPFTISGTPEPGLSGPRTLDDPATLTELISKLKQRAVQEWLQGQLGERFPQFEKALTADFAERYVLDYKVGRTGSKREVLELTGHLDSDSLKKWIRLQDTRKGTTSLKPLLFFTSNIQNFSFGPGETGDRLRDSTIGQTLLTLLNPIFAKINAKPVYADRSSPLTQPAKFDSDLGMLRDYATQMGTNAAIWAHLNNCPTCFGGARVDLLFYSIPATRIAHAESDDLNAKPNEWNNPERMKAVLTPLTNLFVTGVEGLVSSGQFYSQPIRVVVEGVQSYKFYKAMDTEFAQSDFASNPFLKKAGARFAEFEFLTQLSADEVANRIQSSDFGGMRVRAQKFDTRTVVVKTGK